MEIYLDRRSVRQVRISVQEAIDEGDTEACREEVLEAFSEDQIDEIERRLDHGDMFEFLTDILDEWSGEDLEEFFELLETQLGEAGLDLKLEDQDDDGSDDDDEGPTDDDDDDFVS
ncbi:MAG: hypothetical protein MK135_07040 [Polyangiaceae bacterium]|nr:hypothetical protein [Polyangiaceae bacterium]